MTEYGKYYAKLFPKYAKSKDLYAEMRKELSKEQLTDIIRDQRREIVSLTNQLERAVNLLESYKEMERDYYKLKGKFDKLLKKLAIYLETIQTLESKIIRQKKRLSEFNGGGKHE